MEAAVSQRWARSPTDGGKAALASALERLREAVRRNDELHRNDAITARVDELHAAVERSVARPTRATVELIHEALVDERLLALRDSQGQTMVVVLVGALISAGFPYALEVSPEHLARYRARTGEHADVWLDSPLTAVISLMTFMFYGLTTVVSSQVPEAEWSTVLLLLFALLHSGVAVALSLSRSKKELSLRMLSFVGAPVPLALICGVTATLLGRPDQLFSMVIPALLSLPLVATAVACGATSARLRFERLHR